MSGSPETGVQLATGQEERVLFALIGGTQRLMEVVAPCRFTVRKTYDANQWIEYEGFAIAGTAEDEAAWMICKHEYDANGNETAVKWASNDYSKKWSDYATYTYA